MPKFQNPFERISRNAKIDLAALALGTTSVVTELMYFPKARIIDNVISVVRTGAFTLIGSEIVKRVVNGPQDAKTTVVAASESE